MSSTVHFICFVPAIFVGANLYEGAKDLGDIYDVIPNGWNFLQGMAISSRTVRTILCLRRNSPPALTPPLGIYNDGLELHNMDPFDIR